MAFGKWSDFNIDEIERCESYFLFHQVVGFAIAEQPGDVFFFDPFKIELSAVHGLLKTLGRIFPILIGDMIAKILNLFEKEPVEMLRYGGSFRYLFIVNAPQVAEDG